MARYRTDMNSIYISPRAQEALEPIAQCPLTTVVAPMGYGKTTAVQWFLDRRREAGDQVVRVSIYSNDLPLFWRSFQAAWRGTPLAGQLDPMAFPVGDTALGLLSERLLDLLDGAGDYYLFLDDYHLMKDDQVTALLLALARLPGAPLHLIVASRDQVLSPSQALRLGRDLHQITAGDLALNQEEVSAYSRRCGVALPPVDLAHLAQTSEGWFSAVYLNLKAYQAHGTLLTSGHDIYEMLNEAMLDPLPQEQVDFLARMSLADEFTERFVDRASKLVCGDPLDPATDIGPIINHSQLTGLMKKVQRAKDQGALVLLDGEPDGLVMPPVVFGEVDPGWDIALQESFGPLAPIIAAHGEDEALRFANMSDYGLSSAVVGRDVERAAAFALKIDAGMTHVNDMTVADEQHVPFGGEKNSGLGRFNGRWILEEMTRTHWTSVQHAPHPYPF